MLRHGIVQMLENASALNAQPPRNRHNLGCPVTAPFGVSSFFIGSPGARRAGPDGSFRKLVRIHACQSSGRLGYCVRHLISCVEGVEDP